MAKVGGEVASYAPGERVASVSVMQHKGGTWAEFAVVAGNALILRIPEGMTFEQAAVVPICRQHRPEGAAWCSSRARGRGVHRRVAASASAANHDYLRALGADMLPAHPRPSR